MSKKFKIELEIDGNNLATAQTITRQLEDLPEYYSRFDKVKVISIEEKPTTDELIKELNRPGREL